MNRHEIYLQNIRQAYPNLRVESVEFNDEWQNNDVLIVNHEFVFRFPRYARALEQLKVETAILTGVREYVVLDIPNPTFVNLEAQAIGEPFVGYRMIAGEPLWRGT